MCFFEFTQSHFIIFKKNCSYRRFSFEAISFTSTALSTTGYSRTKLVCFYEFTQFHFIILKKTVYRRYSFEAISFTSTALSILQDIYYNETWGIPKKHTVYILVICVLYEY